MPFLLLRFSVRNLVTGWERMEGSGEGSRREWMRWGRRSSCEKEKSNQLLHRRRRESEGGENRYMKILMVKLIVQKEKDRNKNKNTKPTIM
jgi:hypothetical protein